MICEYDNCFCVTDSSVKPVVTTEAEEAAEPAAIHEEANLPEEEELTATVEMDEPHVSMESPQTDEMPAGESESALPIRMSKK